MNNILKQSTRFDAEYCISIVRVGEIHPIENSDFLVHTLINGESIVVRKDQVHEGDILFYASNETQLDARFLSSNNLFEWSCRDLNNNFKEISKLPDEEAKKRVGFFNKHGRVRMIKLRGVPSYGYLFGLNELAKYNSKVSDINLEELVGTDFDEVDGEIFVKAYIPYVPQRSMRKTDKFDKQRAKKLKRFDRLVKNEFQFHYSTGPLPKCIGNIDPDAQVVISTKQHGTSAIFANVRVKNPIKLAIHKHLFNKFIDITGLFKNHKIIDYNIEYGNIYSSRSVIKNQYINKNPINNYYGTDIWGEYNDLLKDYIPKGMTIYGEIIGYLTGSSKMIQKDYDYGCNPGTNKIMFYRITTTNEDGSKLEWNVREVRRFSERLVEEYPELADHIQHIDILYEGTLKDLYPDIKIDNKWSENVLEVMRADKTILGLELDEPLCNNKVPREGIVLRINDDPFNEAFKLKSQKFINKEQKLIDAGDVDIEMAQSVEN